MVKLNDRVYAWDNILMDVAESNDEVIVGTVVGFSEWGGALIESVIDGRVYEWDKDWVFEVGTGPIMLKDKPQDLNLDHFPINLNVLESTESNLYLTISDGDSFVELELNKLPSLIVALTELHLKYYKGNL